MAEGVLEGVGVVAGRGVGVGHDDDLVHADNRRNREQDRVTTNGVYADGGDRNGTAADSDSEGGGRGQVGHLQVLG